MLAFIRGPGTFTTAGQIYVKLLPDGDPVSVTDDPLAKMSPVFSPDGARIAYTVRLGVAPGVHVLPFGDIGPRPSAETYAFSRITVARHLYKIPLR